MENKEDWAPVVRKTNWEMVRKRLVAAREEAAVALSLICVCSENRGVVADIWDAVLRLDSAGERIPNQEPGER